MIDFYNKIGLKCKHASLRCKSKIIESQIKLHMIYKLKRNETLIDLDILISFDYQIPHIILSESISDILLYIKKK